MTETETRPHAETQRRRGKPTRKKKPATRDSEADMLAADALLVTIKGLQGDLSVESILLQTRMEAVQEAHKARMQSLRARLEEAEKGLIHLARQRRSVFFAERDRLDLAHGSLMERVEQRVKRARGVLEALERLGPAEAIKIAKSVDWDKVEKLTDEQLAALGTKRKEERKYTYEVKDDRK